MAAHELVLNTWFALTDETVAATALHNILDILAQLFFEGRRMHFQIHVQARTSQASWVAGVPQDPRVPGHVLLVAAPGPHLHYFSSASICKTKPLRSST